MSAIPIWKDKVVDLGSSAVAFRISADGTVIYTGKAFIKPGASTAKVRINDICADYLQMALPTLTTQTYTAMSLPSFKVQKKPYSTWNDVTTVQFYNDWSYDYGFTGDSLSFPINARIDSRMFVFNSVLDKATPLTCNYRSSGGSTTARSVTISPSPGTGTGVWKANAVANTVRMTINGINYYVVTDCAQYALYYVNAYGGWDQFLIEGNSIESDSVDRVTREMEYDNTSIVNRGTDNFVSDITKTWTFNSGWLTDAEASRMHHLLNSCLVYLCDIASGDFIPVIMSTNTCEYKTFKNQGRQMARYTFTVELAQNRIRR